MIPNFWQLATTSVQKKYNNFHLEYWFLSKNLTNFVSLPWKFDNPYYHMRDVSTFYSFMMWACPRPLKNRPGSYYFFIYSQMRRKLGRRGQIILVYIWTKKTRLKLIPTIWSSTHTLTKKPQTLRGCSLTTLTRVHRWYRSGKQFLSPSTQTRASISTYFIFCL